MGSYEYVPFGTTRGRAVVKLHPDTHIVHPEPLRVCQNKRFMILAHNAQISLDLQSSRVSTPETRMLKELAGANVCNIFLRILSEPDADK